MKFGKALLAIAAAGIFSSTGHALEPAKYVIPNTGATIGTAKEIYDLAPAVIKQAFDQLNSPEMTAVIKEANREPAKDDKPVERK